MSETGPMIEQLTIRRMAPNEANAVAGLVREAFESQALLYSDRTLPPLSESVATVQEADRKGVVLVAERDGVLMGSVRGRMEGDVCYVGRLVVTPLMGRLGIGRELVREVEKVFANACRYEIFTGHRSTPALNLYRSLGYEPYREEPVHEGLTLVFLSKQGTLTSP